MSRKPVAYFFEEGEGMSTEHCATKEQALKAMKELWAEDPEAYERDNGKQEISLDNIKETRYYTHKLCGSSSFHEPICRECGDPCGTNGRRTFVINFS